MYITLNFKTMSLFSDEKSNKIFEENNKLLYEVFSDSSDEDIKKRLIKFVRTNKFNTKYLDTLELKEVLDNGHVVIEGSFSQVNRKVTLDDEGKINPTENTETVTKKHETVITHKDMVQMNDRYLYLKKMKNLYS